MPWTPSEVESYRQSAFQNVLDGMRELLVAMRDELHIDVAEDNVVCPCQCLASGTRRSTHSIHQSETPPCRSQHSLQSEGR